MPAIKILLVDDHRSVLWGLEKLIEGESPRMEVIGKATTSAEAMLLLDHVQPDILLLDLDLGGENGIHAIPALLAKSKSKVLVLTGSRDPSVHDSAMLAGALGVVEKGEPAETILKAIQKVHAGEVWLNRIATGRVLLEMARGRTADSLDPEQKKIASLTPRERQIVAEIGSDAAASSRVIAERLRISEHTLRNHIASIYEKLQVSSRLELFAYAGKHGITPV
ncbi:MAG: response regulator transcription factor [Arenimonas sp.]|jgi:DNA-binding NarL/FixJ family response regulator